MVQDAGSSTLAVSRRALLKGCISGALLASFGLAAGASPILAPGMSYMGARILRRVDRQGMPDLMGDPFGPMTFFVFPVGVAASPTDVYIADAGLGALFRYDPALDAMMPVPGVQVTQQTRIAAAIDGSVVVSDARQGAARRYSRSGRLMQAIDPRNTGSRLDEVVMDPTSGRFLGLDRVLRRIDEIHPVGRSGSTLPEELLPRLPTAMALDRETLYVAGQDCNCVVAIDMFQRDRQILVEELAQVTAMAAGDGWLVVTDNFERLLRLYRGRVLVGDFEYDSLQLANPQGLSISRNTLYVADPGSRRVSTFRLRP